MEQRQNPPPVEKPRQLNIRRKPVGGSHGIPMPQRTPSVQTITEEAPGQHQYVPYRSPVEDPTPAAPSQFQYVAYRRPSNGRRPSNRSRLNRGSISSGSNYGGSFSNDTVSPISPTSNRSQFGRPSMDELFDSVSREASQMRSNVGSRRVPLSPLMEMSAQEAAHRKNSGRPRGSSPTLGAFPALPVESLARSQAGTIRSLYEASRRAPDTSRSSIFRETNCSWLPSALRWPFMLTLFLVSLGLAGLTLGLTVQSQKNHGLGMVHEMGIFLLAWRFVPTIFAVIYTLLTTAMLSDIKRTEPYANLSRPDGASAESSLFLRFRPFWYQPFDALKKTKNDGFRNWALFWALMVNILSLIIVTPFSTALLSPRDVLLSIDGSFLRSASTASSPTYVSSDDSVLFRTISSVLLNTTSTAWVTNDYTVLPFWPSGMTAAPLGSPLSDSRQDWTANTTVYQTDLKCSPMTLQSYANVSLTKKLPSSSNLSVFGTINITSFILKSEDGCSIGLAGYPPEYSSRSIFASGGGWWAGSPSFASTSLWSPGNGSLDDLNPTHPIALNSSTQCGDRSMFFFVTPFKQNEEFKATGQVCKSTYYSAKLPVTVSISNASTTLRFDTSSFNTTKSSLNPTILDIATFESAFLSQDWSTKFQAPDLSSHPLLPTRPRFGGPLALLGAQNSFDVQKMLTNPDLMNQARQIKQRYFGESLMATLSEEGSHQTDSIEGMISFAQRRIVVSFPVGILLTVVLLISSLQIGLVTGYTRLNERPLNLSHDPSSVIAMASLISTGQNTRALFEGLDTASQEWMRKQLGRNIFYLRHGVLYSYDVRDTYQFSETSSHAIAAYNAANSKNWRPKVLQLWFLGPLLVSLFAIIITLALLFALFQNHGIAQVDPSRNNPTLIDLAPYSIFPVLVVVGLKLWWDSMDQKLRKLQPFVSMVKEPPGVFNGSKLSYVATPILWLVWKAARNRHLLLALVAVGAILLEILTISISGLWDRKLGYSKHNATLMRAVDLRTLPTIFTVPSAANDTMNNDVKGALANVFGQMSNEWLYSATTEGISNASILPWTSGEWAFAPLNLSSASKLLSIKTMEDENHAMITIDTPSIRGRLQCEPIDMSNISSWLTVLDFTDKSLWSDTHIPSDLEIGYELKEGLSRNQSLENGTHKFWDDNTPYFSFFAAEYKAQCCGKELNGTPGKASFGYWSSAADARHSSVVVKWVTGRAFSAQFRDSKNQTHLTWKGVPQVTALKCDPVYEVANARVKADAKSGFIQHHEITDIPSPDSNAWSNKYRALNVSSGVPYTNIPSGAEGFEVEPSRFVHNVSVSYGYLFNDMLLSAANSARLGNLAPEQHATENLSDRTFNFRLPGLNVDLMSYTSLALVKNNSSALLDPNILGNVSSTVFSMFFKHFVHAPVSSNIGLYANGSWGLQPRGATLPQDLGATIDSLSTVYLQNIPQPSKTPPLVEGVVVERVEQLEFSPAAVVLSLCILGFLFIATVVILAAHKKHLDHLPRDVDTLGSILGFVYSSDRLLRMATTYVDGGSVSEKMEFLGPTKMGWFNGSGKRRWGIEIVDEREEARTSAPVNTERAREESMDFPIQGFRTTSVSEADGVGGAYGETPQKAARSSTSR